ncbi:MAG: poly-beta-1,6-N-acetyl-D-glucosamine N-deacetylase PgaB [Pseudomonadota bacterium]
MLARRLFQLRQIGFALVSAFLSVLWSPMLMAAPSEVTILCYHEVSERSQALAADYAVTPTQLVRQLDWLKNNGYHFVSMDDVLADRAGTKALPEKSVLLSFDDGYRSVYTHVYPLLKLFNAPAVVAVVGSWLEEKSSVDFDGRSIPRSDFLSWAEIREMQGSGLVEVASHSYALHRGMTGNPQGNKEPAAITRLFDVVTQRYESEPAYQARVLSDLKHNNDVLKRMLGKAPRTMVWPYGGYNATTRALAAKAGMPVGLSLDDGPNTPDVPVDRLRRILVEGPLTLAGLEHEISIRHRNLSDNDRAAKIMHVDLDNVYDPDPVQQERNLGHLLDRIQLMGVNTVYVQAFADPDGNGSADALYFPNRHLPMRADLFNRVVWQISTRTKAKRVYAWMPMLAFDLPANNPAANDVVVTQTNNPDHVAMGYHRLTPFSPRARQVIRDIYQDLSRTVPISGLLFHDDVTLSDYEDASPDALAMYKHWGLPASLAAIRDDDDLLGRWTILKIHWLDNFAKELANVVRQEQPELKTARNLYAQVVLNPRSETWYSQALQNSLVSYDFTAIMAMPYMEQAADPTAFYEDLVAKVKAVPGAMNRVVFELQATNWRNNQPVPSTEMASTIALLYKLGAKHIGYYPDNFIHDHPDPAVLKPAFDAKSSVPDR